MMPALLSYVIFKGFSCDSNLSSILQYAIKGKENKSIKIKFKMRVGIATKSKETSSYLLM